MLSEKSQSELAAACTDKSAMAVAGFRTKIGKEKGKERKRERTEGGRSSVYSNARTLQIIQNQSRCMSRATRLISPSLPPRTPLAPHNTKLDPIIESSICVQMLLPVDDESLKGMAVEPPEQICAKSGSSPWRAGTRDLSTLRPLCLSVHRGPPLRTHKKHRAVYWRLVQLRKMG
jgi:hypothetical protein